MKGIILNRIGIPGAIILLMLFSIPVGIGSSISAGYITFEFYPSEEDYRYCEDTFLVYFNYWSNSGDGTLQMYREPSAGYYYRTVEFSRGYCEFYLVICDSSLSDMREYEGQFFPEADRYIDDGYGGYNAWISIY